MKLFKLTKCLLWIGLVATQLEASDTTKTARSGWTTFSASYDTKKIYVSSSIGRDNYNGLCPTLTTYPCGPKQTIVNAMYEIRANKPDHLLLKSGDTFLEPIYENQKVLGRSVQEPFLISRYGDGPLPIIDSPFPIVLEYPQLPSSAGSIAISHLELKGRGSSSTGVGSYGVASYKVKNLHVEGVRITNVGTGIYFIEGQTAKILRNSISQMVRQGWDNRLYGIFLQATVESFVSENTVIFPSDVTAEDLTYGIYAWYATVRSNIVANAPIGITGDRLQNNLIIGASRVGLSGVRVEYNVVTESVRGEPFTYFTAALGRIAVKNLFLAPRDILLPNQILPILELTAYEYAPITNSGNIAYAWPFAGYVECESRWGNLTCGPTLAFNQDPTQFPNPDRRLLSYLLDYDLGDTIPAFLYRATQNNVTNWNPAYTANAVNTYLRQGFGM